ncbi:type II secretion system protein [Pseudoalteromonas sp. RW-H-Ap-1]|uniref:type II secretion system protein n=2 Tax=unclassified Pseudoalteromonas TaxID=194690 RepID=UPI00390C8C5F|nr:prepilin-type N-terminal cleavage/methylation domain-containing protein [Ningiella sp. W23]
MILASNKPALQSGFTLIEVMVVMTIIALLTGLVGPLAINSLDKAQAKSEILTLKNRLRKISYRAYILQSSAEVTFKGKEITISYNGSDIQPITITNEVLFFNEQVLYFNNYGFVQPLELNLTYRDINTTLDLASLINTSVVPDEQ